MPDLQTPSATNLETLWLIRHLARSQRLRRPLTPAARRALAARSLDPTDCLYLLTHLARLLRAPLAIGPPCSTEHSDHERQLGRALAALEADDQAEVALALRALAAPFELTDQACRRAGTLLTQLAGRVPVPVCGRLAGAGPCNVDHGFSP